MASRLIGDWQIAGIGEAERFFLYAEAYLKSAHALCENMISDESSRTWPNASVVLLLAAHSVELFLKAMIFSRDPKASLGHHKISELFAIYRRHFEDEVFDFDPPFMTEYVGFEAGEIEALKKVEPTPSVLYRYPVDRPGREWKGIRGFEPVSFKMTLEELAEDYARLQNAI